ncbi:MAG: hypothetical protein UY31_C0008G0011 [Candidatus Wolfebacteria bacterium GW2011_GWE1_48_7]|uniref:Uncharacterized protein n=2 Tax=Candidatus Wolfeibacteriota TaxID=1752735 RepID=A0A0G1X6T8_9BACT|nr:MAG: hypothetical protein UX70_C0001G0681 [Candidatus Wolfebacteria bacterium GW2011_GWB1_47_1]KKU37098.1 MAG: hypothetical protein UX49_C0002G0023 [Candidatus Wolfebacteria bacterium GW2011_GWC2_46_275]KKU42396.1 MAG: hypothetical protein UX58_C0002G0110 [Candidatus Wolfebacteria bacterium GW2011_GWB2_46_69]KKU54362.1 MAG: hypothetical protein UX76_C0003G0058 [Candidatus Wolfebacteria bacterium GW2011_GWC1_47_103]KKU59513.1 MAG: hypothetical protein UX83_C0004G0015 [Candidatus Wolfebacteria
MTINDQVFYYKTTVGQHKQKIAVAGLLILATTLSFALGVIIGKDGERAPIIINRCELTQR